MAKRKGQEMTDEEKIQKIIENIHSAIKDKMSGNLADSIPNKEEVQKTAEQAFKHWNAQVSDVEVDKEKINITLNFDHEFSNEDVKNLQKG